MPHKILILCNFSEEESFPRLFDIENVNCATKSVQASENQGCGSGSSGSGPFSVEAQAEARKFYRFCFHIEGKNGGRKEIGSAILRRRANRGSLNIKK